MSTSTATEIRVINIDVVCQATALVERNWVEVALNKRLMVLDPDWPQYYAMEEQGLLLCLGAYVDLELVGYTVDFLIVSHPHYRGMCVGQADVIYVAPEHRAGGVGVRLIKKGEQLIREWAKKVDKPCLRLEHAKDTEAGKALRELLPRMGYHVQDIIFSKEL